MDGTLVGYKRARRALVRYCWSRGHHGVDVARDLALDPSDSV
jgi:hypothetical protein